MAYTEENLKIVYICDKPHRELYDHDRIMPTDCIALIAYSLNFKESQGKIDPAYYHNAGSNVPGWLGFTRKEFERGRTKEKYSLLRPIQVMKIENPEEI